MLKIERPFVIRKPKANDFWIVRILALMRCAVDGGRRKHDGSVAAGNSVTYNLHRHTVVTLVWLVTPLLLSEV
jgi:hypothetical protein